MRALLLACGVAVATAITPAHAAIPAASQVEVIEFYHEQFDHYFIAADPKEIDDLDKGVHAGWKRTGKRFQAVKAGAEEPGTAPICRFYGKPEAGLDSHFYTATTDECATVKEVFPDSWVFESGEVFRAFTVDPDTGKCGADTEPVHRLWNKRTDVNHRYTDEVSVFEAMVAKGYQPEGNGSPALPVVFCVPMKAGTNAAPAGSPVCTLTPSATSPTVGMAIILTASCNGTPSSYTWTGCTSSTSTCTATAAAAGEMTYGVSATNINGTGANANAAVKWQGSTGPLPICTVTASTLTPSVSGSLVLSASCSQTPTRYDWQECSYLVRAACNLIPKCSPTSQTCTVSNTNPGYAHYALAAVNGNGIGPKAGIDVEWTGNAPSGPAPTGPACTISASNSNPPVGSSVTLSASCSGAPTSYAWNGCSSNGSTCAVTSSIPGTLTYSVRASNATATGAPASVQVNWQAPATPQPPSCTVSASNANPPVGQQVTLTASCSGSPTGFQWTNCAGSGAQCTATSANAGPVSYSVQATNNSGTSSAAGVQVNWQAPPTAPPVCTLSASKDSPFTNQSVQLTASCNNAPSSYTWTGCSGTGSTCTVTSSAPGTQNYSVRATNVVGTGADASVSLNWQQSTAPPDYCSAYSDVVMLNESWGGTSIYPADYGGSFRASEVLVVRVTVPASPTSYGVSAFGASVAEYTDPAASRHVTLSRSPCDFGRSASISEGGGNLASVTSSVGAGKPMQAGETWYVNIRNMYYDLDGGTWKPSCQSGRCNIIVGFTWPR